MIIKHTQILSRFALASCLIFLMSCGDGNSGGSEDNWNLDAGDGADSISDIGLDADPSDGGSGGDGHTGVDGADGESGADGQTKTDAQADADGDADAQPDGDVDPSNLRTISDYRRCQSDNDCPVGLGSCITSIPLNRPDTDGTETRPIQDVFPSLEAGQGICTLTCSNSPAVCDDLSVNGSQDDLEPHTCQIVTLGEAPYPADAPAFPFDDQLDSAEQENGQAFGAICRPPIQFDEAIDDSFCEACEMPDGCASEDALCWNAVTGHPAVDTEPGTCLTPCDADAEDACPLGFSCDVQDDAGNSFCRPIADTCTKCQDRDDDGFGTGRCASGADQITGDDCDDRNPNAYLDADNPEHAFPTFCGEFDYNCNGLSDDTEQIGASQFPVAHCVSCFDDCQGELAHGEAACQLIGEDEDESACLPACDEGWTDCDQDLSNGCEIEITDPSRVYYLDDDEDGYGDPNTPKFACDPSSPPGGYVPNDDDCDDATDTVYGGANPAVEICDGLDNNCDGDVDEGLDEAQTSCSTGLDGVCDGGTLVCNGTEGTVCEPNIEPGDQPEICDGGVDNDCDGEVDEAWGDPASSPAGDAGYIEVFGDADGDGYADENADQSAPQYACASNIPEHLAETLGDCDDTDDGVYPNAPDTCDTPDVDVDCDGRLVDADTEDATPYYRDSDGDGWGHEGEDEYEVKYSCSQPDGYVTDDGDCNDASTLINPGQEEVCGLEDADCDSTTTSPADATDAETAYRDSDGDEAGDPDDSKKYCIGELPEDYVRSDDDCNDDEASAHPGEPEICDEFDNNCDGTENEGCPSEIEFNTYLDGEFHTKDPVGSVGSNDVMIPFYCPGGRVLVGVDVYTGDNFDRITLICASLEVDVDKTSVPWIYTVDTKWNNEFELGPIGNDGGGIHERRCGDGNAIYKLTGRQGEEIDRLEFGCREYNIASSTNTAVMTLPRFNGHKHQATMAISSNSAGLI